MNNTHTLTNSLQNILTIIRQLIYENKPLLRTIDESYEKELLVTIALIPKQYEEHILNTIDVVTIILSNINYSEITKQIQHKFNIMDSFSIDVNIKDIITKLLSNGKMTRIEKARISNLVSKLDPIINCINYLIKTPLLAINKVAELTSPTDDLLG